MCHPYIESTTALSDMDTNNDHFTSLDLRVWGNKHISVSDSHNLLEWGGAVHVSLLL